MKSILHLSSEEVMHLQKQIRFNAYRIDVTGSTDPLAIYQHDSQRIGSVLAAIRYDPLEELIVLEGAYVGRDSISELTDAVILAANPVFAEGALNQIRSGNPFRLDRYCDA